MVITGMKHFQSVCQKKLAEWYNKWPGRTEEVNPGDVYEKLSNICHREE